MGVAVGGAPPLDGADEPLEGLEPLELPEPLQEPRAPDPPVPLDPAVGSKDVVVEVVVLDALAASWPDAVGTVSSGAPEVLLFVVDELPLPHADTPAATASAASSSLSPGRSSHPLNL